MMNNIFNTTVTIKRRLDSSVASRDIMNNPIYGAPTNNWNTVYTNIPCRLAFSSKEIQFTQTAERILPHGVAYIPPAYNVYHEDRVITSDGIEYVVTAVTVGYQQNNIIDHYELVLELP